MVVDSRVSYGYKLETQIREAYGRVLYTMTAHEKQAKTLRVIDNIIKISQIILSALTTGGFLTSLIYDKQIASIVGAILSIILLLFNLYTKNFTLIEDAKEHENAGILLWKIREEYINLLTDFENLTEEEIILRRNKLHEKVYEIYSSTPRTSSSSYEKAKKAIKDEEEQSFSEKELDDILPDSLKRENKNYIE